VSYFCLVGCYAEWIATHSTFVIVATFWSMKTVKPEIVCDPVWIAKIGAEAAPPALA
jgi:hydroxymethylpyrimidine/phosphomethylpyrimidine kinase